VRRRRLAGWLAVLAGIVAAAAVVTVSIWGAHRSSEGFPAWLEATSTFAAFTAASVAVFFAMRTQGLEAKRDHRIETALVREQASKVAAWYGTTLADLVVGGKRSGTTRLRQGIRLRNASDLPVSSVLIALTDTVEVFAIHRIEILPPSPETQFESLPDAILAAIDDRGERHSGHWEPTVAIAFIDAAGSGWVRGPMGRLEAVNAEIVYDTSHGNVWGAVGLS